MNIINEVEEIVKWRVTLDPATDLTGVPDGIYPFRYISDDQSPGGIAKGLWCIVVGEKQIAWGREYGIICTIYVEILRVKREHTERCPGDVPFDGTACGLPVYECRPCAKRVELTLADMYGEDLAVCECGRFYTPVAEADDYAIEATL